MENDSLREEFSAAIQEAKRSPMAMLPRLVAAYGIELDGKGFAARCPWCEGKKTFNINNKTGSWLFGCFKENCEAHKSGDEVAFLVLKDGCSRVDACKKLLDMAGITNPYDAAKAARASAAPSRHSSEPEEQPSPTPGNQPAVKPTPAEQEIPAPEFIDLPDEKLRNIYEAAWNLMQLSDDHRAEIRSKRGMPDSWIDALGFRTATAMNARTLSPILEQFPPNELLRSGIAQRDPRDRELRISDSLTGRMLDEDTNQWVSSDNIIIPYIDAEGRIILLRPHKRSISNKRWRQREAVSEFYEKLHNNLRKVYGEAFIAERPPQWAKTVVICEGEFKAAALRMCGIPAIAFQGIHFFRQNKEFKKAIEDTAEMLRDHGVREVIVVFDNEDKSHKEPHERFEAEIYARYTAECMEDSGFVSLFGMLPDEWRQDGKADWDSRLAHHVRAGRGFVTGIQRATTEFNRFLNDRNKKDSRVKNVQRQVDFLNFKEDVINQALHKLRHVPKIFAGGKHEIDLANEIQNYCHKDYTHKLRAPILCDALRATQGGYYKTKAPSEKMQDTCNEILDKIRSEIKQLESDPGRDEDDDLKLRQLRATSAACYAILYRYPKPFTDFTAKSYYKVLVTEADGSTRQDRLITFRDRNGVKSRPCQISSKMMRSAQELRSFFLSMGHYHWFGGQEECDMWGQELDVQNYQRLIEEIDTYGWNKEKKFYLLGDCAVLGGGEFKFPDKDGIIWVHGTGYKNSDNMASFTTKPPFLFPESENPKEAYAAMDWEEERKDVEAIWRDLLSDYAESFGGYAGYAVVAGLIQYLSHPEVRPQIGGKPGLWVQGEKGSGKTKSIEFAMRIIGYPLNYGFISLGGTKVGVERSLCQFSNLPFHIDEWRNENADPKLEDLLRNCYNETATPKGTPNGNKGVRKLVPSTIPIVTGEDGSTDAALRSRYVRLIASQSYDNTGTGDESDEDKAKSNVSDQRKRDDRYYRIMERSDLYHRIGRFLFKFRDKFAADTVEYTKDFGATPAVMEKIKDSRARQVFGVFFGSLLAAQKLISSDEKAFGPKENRKIMDWFVAHGAESAEETERDVFRRMFFSECVTMIDRGISGIDKLIRARRGYLDADGRVKLYEAINETEGRLYIMIAASELFAEYKADKRKRGENAPIAQHNILAELRTQPAWVPAPRNDKARQHRFGIPGEKNSKRSWWVLDYKRLDPELKNIFQKIWERELSAADLDVDADGESPAQRNPFA